MNINTNKPVFNKDLFHLNDEKVPSDQNKFHDGLTYLANDALKALKQPDEVEWAFQQIEKLNTQKLTSNNTHAQVQTVFHQWIKIQFGDRSRYIPKEHLQKHCGKKFQGQFTANMKDKNSRVLELSPPEGVNISEIPAVVREGFLSYLQTGVVSDDAVEENVMSLMDLAYQHQVDSLVEHCSSLIQANIDDENLEIVLEFINNRHLTSLRWACLEFMCAHPENIPEGLTKDDQEALNLLNSIPDTIELKMSTQGNLKVNITKQLKNSSIEYLVKINNNFPISSVTFLDEQQGGLALINEMSQKFENIEELIINDPSFKSEQYIKIQEQFPKLTDFGNGAPFLSNFDDVIVYLKNFRNPNEADSSLKKLTIRSLNLSAIHNLTDAQIEELKPYLQEIYHLFINSDKITKIIAPKASRVNCSGCTNLETLLANQAEKVYCYGCTSLKTLEANQANKVYCRGCTSLKSLEANQAELINCHDCTSLETLEANQAYKVYCNGCTNLKTLEANQAELISCDDCTNLETLQANQAEWINCKGCKSLETLETYQAKEVDCRGCTSLETLQANQAIKVDCRGCTNLKTLQASKAVRIICNGCAYIKTLEANQAKKVDCRGCTNLKTLQASKAVRINCKGCTSLKTLQTNQAEWINCRGCKSLETLQANQAEVICIHDCTSLKTLQINHAKAVYCSGCTNLETLEANQAETINCSGFKSLKTLQANQAETVNCSGCTSLRTLKINQAEKVNCRGCTNLETLQVNKAVRIKCKSCTSLKSLQTNQAKEVDCRGCTSLKTLLAYQAETVNCSGCTSLITLQAIQAEWVNCRGCTSLKTLQANQAIEVDCMGCASLKTLEVNQAKWVDCAGCTNLKIFRGSFSLLPFKIAIHVAAYWFYL